MANSKKLTKQGFWEDYWAAKLKDGKPVRKSLLMLEIFKVFNKYLPFDSGKNILEIGGAPGEYLLYMTSKFGYQVHSLDYSNVGNEQTKATFLKAGMEVTVYERDLFANNNDLPKFDIVYSLGFIEHFDDPAEAIRKHLDLLKPGGILLLGVPNLSGIYHVVLKHLSPSHDQSHNMSTMNLDKWRNFEKEFELNTVFKGYIGGFEPMIMKKLDVVNFLNRFLYFVVKSLMVIFSLRMSFLRRINSKYWSGYLIGIYKKSV